MMNVSSVGGSGPIGKLEPRGTEGSREVGGPVESARVQRGEDRVELTGSSLYMAKLRELPEIRQDLVERIKAQIEAGTYETPDKVDGAIEAFLQELEEGL